MGIGLQEIRVNPTSPLYDINVLKPTDYVMHHQFNIQQLYALPTYLLTYSMEQSPSWEANQ